MKNIKDNKIIKESKKIIKNDKKIIKNDTNAIKNNETKRNKKKINIKRIEVICIFLIIIVLIILIFEKHIGTKEKLIPNDVYKDNEQKKQDTMVIVNEKDLKIYNSKTTDWNLILVNKDNKIPEDYQFKLTNIEYENKVDSRIAEYVTNMIEDARRDGLKPLICSSYRSENTQQTLYAKKVNEYKKNGYSNEEAQQIASYWVTLPRTSEHEIGLSVDIVSKDYQILDEGQERTEVQKWLIEHCNDYGFVLRYPTSKKQITKINYEPWHYRYVGVENAKFMKEHDYCLEEYIEYLEKYE